MTTDYEDLITMLNEYRLALGALAYSPNAEYAILGYLNASLHNHLILEAYHG